MKRFSSFEYHNKTLDLIIDEISEDKQKEAMAYMTKIYEALPSYKTLLGNDYYQRKMNEKWKIVYDATQEKYQKHCKNEPKDAQDWCKQE